MGEKEVSIEPLTIFGSKKSRRVKWPCIRLLLPFILLMLSDSPAYTLRTPVSEGAWVTRIVKTLPYFGNTAVEPPELDPLVPDHGSPGTEITVTGKYFGTKKGEVFIEDPVAGTRKKCRITYWYMDEANGNSELRFVVPLLSKTFPPNTYTLEVVTKGGIAQTTFTVLLDDPGFIFPFQSPEEIGEVYCFALHPWSAGGEIHGGFDIVPEYKNVGYRKYAMVASSDSVVERTQILPADGGKLFTILVVLKVNDYWHLLYIIEPQSLSEQVNAEQLQSVYAVAGRKIRKGEVVGELVVSELDVSSEGYPHLHYGLLYKNPSDSMEYVLENYLSISRSDGTNLPPTTGPGSPWNPIDLGIASTLYCPYVYSSPNAQAFFDSYPKKGIYGRDCACLCAYGSTDGDCGVCEFRTPY